MTLSSNNPYRNDDAERALLGSLFIRPESFDVVSWLRAEAFGNKLFGAIYAAISTCARLNEPIDILVVSNRLREAGVLEAVGGLAGLTELMEIVPTGVHAPKYADLVYDAYKRRQLKSACETALEALNDGSADASEIGRKLSADADIVLSGKSRSAVSIGEIAAREIEPLPRIRTNFPSLDAALNGGIAPTDLIVVGAAPKVGKSQFVLQVIANSEIVLPTGEMRQARALLVSLEMSEHEIECRLISRMGQLPLGAAIRLRSRQAMPSTISTYGERFDDARKFVRGLDRSVLIETKPMNIFGLQSLIALHRHEIDFVVLDYLQLLGETHREQREYDKITEASRLCKTLAQRYAKPIVAVSQLNRSRKENGPGRPNMSQLRGSGQIEQDANAIILLHRDLDETGKVVTAEVGLVANRSGPTFWEEMDFNAETGIYFPREGGMFE